MILHRQPYPRARPSLRTAPPQAHPARLPFHRHHNHTISQTTVQHTMPTAMPNSTSFMPHPQACSAQARTALPTKAGLPDFPARPIRPLPVPPAGTVPAPKEIPSRTVSGRRVASAATCVGASRAVRQGRVSRRGGGLARCGVRRLRCARRRWLWRGAAEGLCVLQAWKRGDSRGRSERSRSAMRPGCQRLG